MITGIDVDQVWQALLNRLLTDGLMRSPRGLKTKELLAVQVRINMKQPLLAVRSRKLGYRFACAEAAWILEGDNRLSKIRPYAKMMAEFSDDGITLAGAYGPPLRDQLSYAIRALTDDHATRRAVVTLWRPRPGPSKDIPCTVSLQWLIRGDQLHCVATMRSSDAWLGLPYDVFTFSCISAYVVASAIGVVHRGLGNLYLTMGSSHLYERHWEPARIASLDQERVFVRRGGLPSLWGDPESLIQHLWWLAEGRWDRLSATGWLVPGLQRVRIDRAARTDKEDSP